MEYYNEYLIQEEPDKRDRVRNWMAAIGLQDVDGLTPSNYMLETVRRNIEGEITIEEVGRLVDEYYTTQEGLQQESRTLEANYSNIQYGIKETTEYLERFFRNLLMGEKNELKNRYMIIGTSWNNETSTQESLISTQENIASTQEIQPSSRQTTAERIIEEIRKHPFTTREQLAKVIGITPDGIKKQLDKLKKAGKIRHVGSTKKGHWEIIE